MKNDIKSIQIVRDGIEIQIGPWSHYIDAECLKIYEWKEDVHDVLINSLRDQNTHALQLAIDSYDPDAEILDMAFKPKVIVKEPQITFEAP